jgi:hypothetical protein
MSTLKFAYFKMTSTPEASGLRRTTKFLMTFKVNYLKLMKGNIRRSMSDDTLDTSDKCTTRTTTFKQSGKKLLAKTS